MKKTIRQIITALVLLGVLVGWISLPWQAVLALLLVLVLWLALTRLGQQTLAITMMGVSTLKQRIGPSLVIVVGIAGVVGVMVSMLAMAEGLRRTLEPSGSEDSAIVLRSGARVEANSIITREQASLIGSLPGVARDEKNQGLISAELSQMVSLPTRDGAREAHVQVRGVEAQAWQVRPDVRVVAGRKPEPGKRELLVGEAAQRQFEGLDIGQTVDLVSPGWLVVGVMKAGDASDSEIWTDATTLANAHKRTTYQSVVVRLAGAQAMEQLKAALESDPRLDLQAETTRDYFLKQSQSLTQLISALGAVIGGIMAIGASFGALNTMYAAVAKRSRDIGVLRALGFRNASVVLAVLMETMLVAALGGALGAVLAWLLFNGQSVSTATENFNQLVFEFHVTPALLWTGMKWALAIGLIGGSYPALRAARMQVTDSLRAV